MAERLTRAHRRKIENETKKKLDLDHLAEVNVKEIEKKIEDAEEKAEEKESESESDEENEEGSSEEDSDEESDEESEEEVDLDELLNNAEAALKANKESIQLEEEKKEIGIKTKLSKIDTGISVDKEIYLKKTNGRTKLVPDAVAFVEEGVKPSKKASIVLQESKTLDRRPTKAERQEEKEKTAGKAWFDMPRAVITEEVKRDLQVLKMRHILDRKRHYKKMGKKAGDPKYFQVGTIIESPTEFFSARINKKDRKQTIVDELMATDELKSYYKRKYNEVYEKSISGGKKHYKKLKAQRQWAK